MQALVLIHTAGVRERVGAALRRHGFEPTFCDTPADAAQASAQWHPPAAVVEVPPGATDAAAVQGLWPDVDPESTLLVAVVPGASDAVLRAAAEAGAVELLDRLDDDALDARLTLLARRIRRCTQCRHVRRQRQMQENLARLAAIVENSDDAIIGELLDGTITSWNAGAERIFGYTADEAVGHDIAMIVPPEREEELEHLLSRLRHGGHVNHFETVRMRRDGRRIQVSLSVSPLRDPEGLLTGASVIGRDITERKRLEAQILQATEDERRRIGRDLHDGLGSHLTGVSLTCRALARRYARGKHVDQSELDGVAVMVQEAAQQARLLARGLDPIKIADRGLAPVLDELAAMARKASGVHCVLTTDGDLPALPPGVTTHLYRIAQEAVNNALKHARAEHIYVQLSRTDHALSLSVRDDGVGLSSSGVPSEGIGQHVMQYRADVVGATFSLRDGRRGGTVMTVQLPVDRPEHGRPQRKRRNHA